MRAGGCLLVARYPVVGVDRLERDLHVADLALGQQLQHTATDAAQPRLHVDHAIGVVEGTDLDEDQTAYAVGGRDEPLCVAVDLGLGFEHQIDSSVVTTTHVLSDDLGHPGEEHLRLVDVVEEIGIHPYQHIRHLCPFHCRVLFPLGRGFRSITQQ